MELLIVVVVIAILAAITIVAYNGIQNRAKQSAAQTTAKQALTKVQSYMVENADTYPADLATVGLLNSGSTTYQYRVDNASNPKTFCLTATTQNISYYVSNSSNAPTVGGCVGHGANGVAAVTNLLSNPSWELASPLTAATSNTGTSTATLSSSADWSNHGSQSLKIAIPGSSTSTDTAATIAGGSSTLTGLGVTFVPGRTYSVTATVYVPAAQTSPSARARSLFYANSVDGWQSSAPFVTAAPNTPGTYTLSTTFTVPVGATWATVRLYNGSATPNGPIYWDSVILTETNTPVGYADGSSPNWMWNGTANNSTSVGPQQ